MDILLDNERYNQSLNTIRAYLTGICKTGICYPLIWEVSFIKALVSEGIDATRLLGSGKVPTLVADGRLQYYKWFGIKESNGSDPKQAV